MGSLKVALLHLMDPLEFFMLNFFLAPYLTAPIHWQVPFSTAHLFHSAEVFLSISCLEESTATGGELGLVVELEDDPDPVPVPRVLAFFSAELSLGTGEEVAVPQFLNVPLLLVMNPSRLTFV